MNDFDKVIVTDVDGVLLNWEFAFHTWMQAKGFERKVSKTNYEYDISYQYNIGSKWAYDLVLEFNASASMGFLPPLRDAIHYVRKLHEEKGYVFDVVTSMSSDPCAQRLRIQNLEKLFGDTVFRDIVILGCGANKYNTLKERYEDSGYLWVEDKEDNAIDGQNVGMQAVLMEHGHNMYSESGIQLVKGWKDIYEMM